MIDQTIATALIVMAALTLLLIAKDFYLDAKDKKRHKDRMKAYEKFTNAVDNLKLDVVEIESLKRHIRMLLTQIDMFENKLDQEYKPYIVDGDNLDLDALTEQVDKAKAAVIDDKSILEKIIEKGTENGEGDENGE